MTTEHGQSYSSLVEQTAEAVMPAAVATPTAFGPFVMVDGGFVEVAAITDKWGERGDKAPSCEGFEGRGDEENQAVWVVRRHLTGPKQSTHGYMCRFCHRLFQGGPQIIRAHVTGQAQGKNGGVRSRACTSPPTTLKEEWSRPPLSKEQKLQQKADRLEAKRLKAELKKASGATLAAIQQDDGGGTKRSLTDHMTLSLQTDQVEVVCNLRDDVRRVYVTESIALHELRQRLCAEYGAEALDIRYRGDDGGFGPMHSQHHLDLAKAMASQAACALYLSLAAQGSDDFSTLGLEHQDSEHADKRRRMEEDVSLVSVGGSLTALVESA